MFQPDRSANETVTSEYNSEYGATAPTTDRANEANGRKAPRKVLLAVTVTCPACGFANKPEWMSKLHSSDTYATTVLCKQCGSLLAVWAMQVDAQVLAQNPGNEGTTTHPEGAS